MIVCFDCPSNIKRLLDSMIKNGEYEDYSEAIISAIQNLLVIQEEVKKKGVAFMGHDEPTDGINDVSRTSGTTSFQNSGAISKPESEEHKSIDRVRKQKSGIPIIFSLENLKCDLSDVPDDQETSTEEFGEYPVNHWIFGMYNRLLPAKANCRALARIISERGGHGIPVEEQLESVAYEIAEDAAKLGDYLRKHDKNFNLKRDDGLSTAFPGSAPKDEKSRLRYASQFVARVDSSENISGLLVDYRFIEKTEGPTQVVKLTKSGWEFALLKNPVFDNFQSDPYEKFAGDEIEYLTAHILERVQVECSAFMSLLNAMSSEDRAPTEIDQELLKLYSGTEDTESKSSRISSQRSGAISRMIDLKLLSRIRTGVKIKYSITGHGRELLNKIKQKADL